MIWPEVEQARDENRYELVLSGEKLVSRLGQSNILDQNIFKLKRLHFLELSNSKSIELIPDAIDRLENLTDLDLSSNKIHRVEQHFRTMVHLRHLNLSNNSIERIDQQAFVQLRSLETLNLSINRLDRFEFSSLSNCTRLHCLNVSSNEILTIDSFPTTLESLSSVDLSSNRIEHFPESLVELNSVKTIDLSSNRISSIPPRFASIKKIKGSFIQRRSSVVDIRLLSRRDSSERQPAERQSNEETRRAE